jgi:hypothetical protein
LTLCLAQLEVIVVPSFISITAEMVKAFIVSDEYRKRLPR